VLWNKCVAKIHPIQIRSRGYINSTSSLNLVNCTLRLHYLCYCC